MTPLSQAFLTAALSAVGEIGIDHDRLGAGLHHRVDLLDLALRVGPGDLDLQVDLVGAVTYARPWP